MKNKFLFFFAVLLLPVAMQANNIRVGIQSFDKATRKLTINLAWDNSWGNGTAAFRDGAWIFIKYKDITDVEWRHGIIENIPASTVLTDTLSGAGVKFDLFHRNQAGTNQNRGAIVRRTVPFSVSSASLPIYSGVYNVAMQFTLSLYLPAGVSFVNPEFKVFALEMVDIPTGAFSVGDGSSDSYLSSNNSSSIPKVIASETAITSGLYKHTDHSLMNVPYAFSKGYSEFYIMKYELSNEGLIEFLNTLTRAQQNTHYSALLNVPSGTVPLGGGNTYASSPLRAELTGANTPARFYCDINSDGITTLNDGQFLPAVTSTGEDLVFAYLSWAALRPLTGFEFEKASRGIVAPVMNEFAWGSALQTNVNTTTLTFVDRFGPGETVNQNFEGPVNTGTVVRCGFFAKPTGSTRLNTGGSYYGVMDLSNNADEFTLGYGVSSSPGPVNGNGYIASDGYVYLSGWGGEYDVIKKGQISHSAFITALGIRGGIR